MYRIGDIGTFPSDHALPGLVTAYRDDGGCVHAAAVFEAASRYQHRP
jgi:hypothetical protein